MSNNNKEEKNKTYTNTNFSLQPNNKPNINKEETFCALSCDYDGATNFYAGGNIK